MLRLACCLATERGVRVVAPVHDAVMVEAPAEDLDRVVRETQRAMAEASGAVLDGFLLRTNASVVRHPNRYRDNRGADFWQTLMAVLDKVDKGSRSPGEEG
jgi:hypothetical protein